MPARQYLEQVHYNATHAGGTEADPATWWVTQEMMEREIAKVKKAKVE